MKLIAGAVMAMSMVAGAAQAGDWRMAAVNFEDAMFLDVSSIRNLPYGQKKVAWIAKVFSETNEARQDYVLVQAEYDCSEMTVTLSSIFGYGADNQSRGSSDRRQPPFPAIPDSMWHHTLRAVCDGLTAEPSFGSARESLRYYRGFLAGLN